MKAEVVVDGEDVLLGNVDLGTVFIIEPVGVGNDGVQSVVSTRELEYHEGALRFARSHQPSPYAVRP
jgi:hypothetical protein